MAYFLAIAYKMETDIIDLQLGKNRRKISWAVQGHVASEEQI